MGVVQVRVELSVRQRFREQGAFHSGNRERRLAEGKLRQAVSQSREGQSREASPLEKEVPGRGYMKGAAPQTEGVGAT